MNDLRRKRPKRCCHCSAASLPFSSSLLFLSIVLPSSSYAQIAVRQDTATPLSSSIAPSPTSFITSVSATSSASASSSSSTLGAFPSPNSPSSNNNSDTDPDLDGDGDSSSTTPISEQETHAFNYYFLIIAAFAIILCICLVYLGRRKKRKAALLRSNSQRALARDVAGFRSRVPARGNLWAFGGFGIGGGHGRVERVEGLDERGEAPPPYIASSKSTSASTSAPSTSAGEAVELSRMDSVREGGRGGNDPPGYNDAISHDDRGNITRPTTALTASDRSESTRDLLGHHVHNRHT